MKCQCFRFQKLYIIKLKFTSCLTHLGIKYSLESESTSQNTHFPKSQLLDDINTNKPDARKLVLTNKKTNSESKNSKVFVEEHTYNSRATACNKTARRFISAKFICTGLNICTDHRRTAYYSPQTCTEFRQMQGFYEMHVKVLSNQE